MNKRPHFTFLSPSFARSLSILAVTFLWVCALVAQEVPVQKEHFDAAATFTEICDIVERDFYRADFGGRDWPRLVEQYRSNAIEATNRDNFARTMNELLTQLGTSHTYLFPITDPRRYQILGIFEFLARDDQSELLEYEGIGMATLERDGISYVHVLYDGLPASQSGILYGDEIVSIDDEPYHPIESFSGKAGKTVKVQLRRERNGKSIERHVEVQMLNGRKMFEDAMQASARKIDVGNKKVAYVHVWSYAGIKYQEKLKSMLLFGDLVDCDALILDLRDGWGGASLEYLNLFREPVLTVTSVSRNSEKMQLSGVWGKPVVLLVNERTTSGKELFAFGFKHLDLGEVVGVTTAGAVVAGRPYLLSSGDVLYLAIADVAVNGVRLEGVGVAPTIEVERPLPYSQGKDPQLEAALESLR